MLNDHFLATVLKTAANPSPTSCYYLQNLKEKNKEHRSRLSAPHVMFPQRIVVISHSTKVLSHIWAEVYTSKWRNEQGLTGFDRKELMLTVPQLEANEGQSWALCALTAGPGHKVRALKQTTQKHRLRAHLLELCSRNSVTFPRLGLV